MFTSILIATDGSVHSERAVELGCGLAAKFKAKLTLLHIVGHGALPKGFEQWAEAEHLAQHTARPAEQVENFSGNLAAVQAVGESEGYQFRLHQIVGERIMKQAREAAKSQGINNVKEYIDTGEPVSCVLERAKDEAVDAIVMGTRGMSELKGLLMGSVSHKVCQLADAACILVK